MATEQTEREDKFDVTSAFVVPALRGLVPKGGRVESATIELNSVYFDTAEKDLLAFGVTLRSRAGDADTGWQLKVPAGPARTELRLPATAQRRSVPKEFSALVAGISRGRPLRPVVTIRSSRTVQRLMNADGQVLVEIADDHAAAAAPGAGAAVVSQWREVEAELGPAGDEQILAQVGRQLRAAGAKKAASANKVARALTDPRTDGHAVVDPGRPTAGGVILRYLTDQDTALLVGDLGVRRDAADMIHPTRVATRRMRSTLRVFAALFDPAKADAFDAELAWYAGLLGAVRDPQVQRKRFAAALADIPAELVLGPVAARIEQHLLDEELTAQNVLATAMTSERYFALLAQSGRWSTDPPFTAAAGRPPARLAKPVRRAQRTVGEHLRAGVRTGQDETLHKARKAAKRARYAAELSRPVLGRKRAHTIIARFEKLQETLGEHQDSVVAADLLRRLGAAASDGSQNGFTFGLLYEREMQRAAASRHRAATLLNH